MNALQRSIPLFIVVACAPTASVIADEEEARRALAVEKQHVEETLRLGIAEGRTYDIRVLTDPSTQVELNERSILRWTNPITGAYGELFVWTHLSRPLVVASVYQYYSPDQYLAIEFQSLAPSELIAARGSEEVWHPSSAGVEFQLLRQAPRPAASKSERPAQMRTLARGFQVRFTTPEDEREWLRLLPQPNCRYQSEDDQILDGAIFIYAQGTNPEALLLLEARHTKNGDQWYFALGRQTGYQLQGFHDGEVVWSVPMALGDQKLLRTEAYTTFFRYSHGSDAGFNRGAP